MKPTMKFRWLEIHQGDRTLINHPMAFWDGHLHSRVLQQWWEGEVWKENESSPSEIFGEWRDIPIEVEE